MTKRLFLAINLPQEIKSELQELVLKLQKNNKNKPIKWVELDNFHLTLHFLGDIPEEKIADIHQNLKPIVTNYPVLKFNLLDKISAFPDPYNPKVIFLEMEELNGGKIIKMQKEIGETLAKLGFKIDFRPFRLHLTLGRVKFKTSLQLPNLRSSGASVGQGQFQISSIDLMESQLTPTGPIYSIINKYPLNTL